MKQPDLGIKIAELRKAKGLTQEELVERCNISVRTIQRIETGEVTPRSYTIKTILSALGSDFEQVIDTAENDEGEVSSTNKEPSSAGWFKNQLLIDVPLSKPTAFLRRQLTVAWVFGVIYFILSFLEGAAEYVRFVEGELLFGTTAYIVLKGLMLVSIVYFLRGILIIGGMFENYLLRIMSAVLIGAHVLLLGFDVLSLLDDSVAREPVMIGAAVLFGVIGIVYGIALSRLEKSLGASAKFAAIFEILAGFLFLSVVFALVGEFVHIPAELLQIILIFKAQEIIKIKGGDNVIEGA